MIPDPGEGTCKTIANCSPRQIDLSGNSLYFLLQCGNVATPGHDEWCYADTVTLSVTHNHTENTGQEIADRKVNFVQLKTSTQTGTTLARMN